MNHQPMKLSRSYPRGSPDDATVHRKLGPVVSVRLGEGLRGLAALLCAALFAYWCCVSWPSECPSSVVWAGLPPRTDLPVESVIGRVRVEGHYLLSPRTNVPARALGLPVWTGAVGGMGSKGDGKTDGVRRWRCSIGFPRLSVYVAVSGQTC